MPSNLMKSSFATGLLGAMLWLVPSVTMAADITDGGSFFSAETLATANQSIRDLEQKSGHTIRIETFAAVPADKAEAVAKMDAKQREAFFSKWVHDRAEATQSRGIVVLMCRQPSHLNIWAGTPIQRAGFGGAEAKAIRETMLTSFRAKEYDKGLTSAVAQLSTTLASMTPSKTKAASVNQPSRDPKHAGQPVPAVVRHIPAGQVPTSPTHAPTHQVPVHQAAQSSPWTGIVVVLMFVVGGIFMMSMIGRMFGGGGQSNRGYGAAGGGYGGGGGGFMQGLAGGIFGAMAGNWIYDQFSGHSASAGEMHSSGSSLGSSDPSSSGWADSGSGSSDTGFSGGTDFGGGDFGSGDSGGGSDFGGGGDF